MLRWTDTVGVAAFCVIGAQNALRLALPGIVVVGCGAITATGGGVVRDLLVGRPVRSSGELRVQDSHSVSGSSLLHLQICSIPV